LPPSRVPRHSRFPLESPRRVHAITPVLSHSPPPHPYSVPPSRSAKFAHDARPSHRMSMSTPDYVARPSTDKPHPWLHFCQGITLLENYGDTSSSHCFRTIPPRRFSNLSPHHNKRTQVRLPPVSEVARHSSAAQEMMPTSEHA